MSNTKTAKRRRRWKQLLGAGALALGMATAWGSSASAGTVATDKYLNLSFHTEQSISDAFIYYYIGNSQYALQSLGTQPLPVGDSTRSLEAVPTPSWGYSILGLYGEGTGVVASFFYYNPLSPVTRSWEYYFNASNWGEVNESDVVDWIQEASAGQTDDLRHFFQHYGTSLFACPFDEQATLVAFTDAKYGGTVTTAIADEPLPQPTAVPEPATWVLLVGMAGVALVGRRKLIG